MSFDLIPGLPQSSPGWDLVKTLFSYYGLRSYFSNLYDRTFHSEKIRKIHAYGEDSRISGEQYFWQQIMSGQLLEGEKVQLLNFQISPWFPRKPGLYWTYNAAIARRKAWEDHIESIDREGVIFDVGGKTLMTELGGIGSVNFRKNREEVLLTATASGVTERGIPLICPDRIWTEIWHKLQRERMIEVDLLGTIKEIPAEYDHYMLRTSSFPKIAVEIGSILDIKLKTSRLQIKVSPWTIFELPDNDRPYGFTFVYHDLFSSDISEATNWIMDYIEQREGSTILTDFDEERNQLNAEFPLSDCIVGNILGEIIGFCQKIAWDFQRGRY